MPDSLIGKLLVAMPGIGDPRFDRSVIMMCAHDAEHAMGVVINRPRDEIVLREPAKGLSRAFEILAGLPDDFMAARDDAPPQDREKL